MEEKSSLSPVSLLVSILKYSIAAFALIFGGYNVYRYIKTRKDAGCDVVNKDQRKKIMTKTKKVVSTENFALALIGIMVSSET